VPEDHNPREITLELIGVSADKAPVGSELGTDVRLLNSGKQSIQIPWSIDSKTVTEGFSSFTSPESITPLNQFKNSNRFRAAGKVSTDQLLSAYKGTL